MVRWSKRRGSGYRRVGNSTREHGEGLDLFRGLSDRVIRLLLRCLRDGDLGRSIVEQLQHMGERKLTVYATGGVLSSRQYRLPNGPPCSKSEPWAPKATNSMTRFARRFRICAMKTCFTWSDRPPESTRGLRRT